ncbi:MAG: amino acid ABC transporter permease [Chloroflexota bacterium]|nr:amino acid ABC transporter permease [Chloroflexota bacterium]
MPNAAAGQRASRLLGVAPARQAPLIAVASTLVFFGLLAGVVVNSPGWSRVRQAFLDEEVYRASFPEVASAFLVNVQLFSVAEAAILVVALVIAILRGLPGPVFFPVRLLAIAYSDLFRGVPGVLVIFILGFGIPGLDLPGVPRSPFFWGVVALVLLYSAYVSEVYRAGIESIHPSQEMAARSLGLSRLDALRFVIVPQAVRRVIPPLLNDFIGLQKDTALVSFIGVVEVFRQSQIDVSATFNYTPYLATALLFIVLTIPLARLTDWLVARDRRRFLALGGSG